MAARVEIGEDQLSGVARVLLFLALAFRFLVLRVRMHVCGCYIVRIADGLLDGALDVVGQRGHRWCSCSRGHLDRFRASVDACALL